MAASIGQLAATTPASIVGSGGGVHTLSLLFYNAHATDDQVVEITLTRGSATARTIFKDTLKIKEKLVISNFPLEDDDELKAAATAATSVNYVVLPGTKGGLFDAFSLDSTGARKGTTTAATQTFTGDLSLLDSIKLKIGTSDDITIAWDGTDLDVLQATANSSISWGIGGAGIDQVWNGDTASAVMTWDQSADSLIFSGVAKIKLQTIVAATGTAIPVTHSGSFPITQNGAETNTLAIPTFIGQQLDIFVDTDTSGARVITSAQRINQAGNTIITLTEVGDFIRLVGITIGGALRWQVVSNDGAALS